MPYDTAGMKYLDDPYFAHATTTRLDAVGGTVLYMKADLYRQGVVFPVYHVVGTDWSGEGWDAVETAGLCVVARFVGHDCYGMPGFVALHASSDSQRVL